MTRSTDSGYFRSERRRAWHRAFSVMLAFFITAAAVPLLGSAGVHAAAGVTASGLISSNDVNLRESAGKSSKSLGSLKKNTKVEISEEVFTSKKGTSSKKRWYHVSVNGKTGYVRADLVGSISYGSTGGKTTDELNYRKGPATSFKRLGTASKGSSVTLQLTARRANSSELWYRASIAGKTAYICAKYVSVGGQTAPAAPKAAAANAAPAQSSASQPPAVDLSGKSELAAALLSNPTDGGAARVVYTFSTSNCSKLFAIKGHEGISTPQGFTFTGEKYYILYGTAAGQRIVTYSADGRRLAATRFSFSIGHPNGISWDPITGMCYVFKGNQKTIYTWNPATNEFGKSKTPYSSSGVGFDNANNVLCASSHTGIRVYSADGLFTHQKLFARCKPGIFHYIQDCGAGSGFVFHGISGANKKKTNFLDVYRIADGKYLGSVKITIGEYESAVVGSDGFLQLLINTKGKTDYVWKTPLNVNELK